MKWPKWKRHPARATINEGFSLLRRGDVETAERVFEACRQRDPANARVLEGLAESALQKDLADQYLRWTNELLALRDAIPQAKRVTICHRQADVCLNRLGSPERAAEVLAHIELDYPGSADAARARRRIEQILAGSGRERETANDE